jgi:hypothetical protein
MLLGNGKLTTASILNYTLSAAATQRFQIPGNARKQQVDVLKHNLLLRQRHYTKIPVIYAQQQQRNAFKYARQRHVTALYL